MTLGGFFVGSAFFMRVRLAELCDSDDLLAWRNDEVTRKMSFNSGLVELSSHKEWLERSLDDDNRILVIGLEGDEKVGVVRFDNDFRSVEVSINLNPAFRGRGLASKLLEKSETIIPRSWGSKQLLAKIKKENLVSVRTFEGCGYALVRRDVERNSDIYIYEKKIS